MIRERAWGGRKAETFTLQWHLTNRCAYRCRHCYDRSDRPEMDRTECLAVLEDLRAFGRRHRVKTRLCLTGGDPLLHSCFWDLYRAAADADLPVTLLGNPATGRQIDRLIGIRLPGFYQVSLEGLEEHNDSIRGSGHYEKVMAFLHLARQKGLPTRVMLTLTRDNLDQVLPLGERLRGLTEGFTFNRLSPVGEGAALLLPSPPDFAGFLEAYSLARKTNPVFGFKDNLFNILRERHRRPLLPGCTGYGCGAAFNFVALLPDGEVHACRKFPSLLGSIRSSDLDSIYRSRTAEDYRRGSLGCRKCRLRKACGGCLAVTAGTGRDPLAEKDPFCFRVP